MESVSTSQQNENSNDSSPSSPMSLSSEHRATIRRSANWIKWQGRLSVAGGGLFTTTGCLLGSGFDIFIVGAGLIIYGIFLVQAVEMFRPKKQPPESEVEQLVSGIRQLGRAAAFQLLWTPMIILAIVLVLVVFHR